MNIKIIEIIVFFILHIFFSKQIFLYSHHRNSEIYLFENDLIKLIIALIF